MAEECTATSAVIASSSPTPHSWWDLHHHHHPTNSFSLWSANSAANSTTTTTTTTWHHHHQNPNSNSSNNNNICDQDDVLSISTSLTNASNHSVLTVDDQSSGGGGGGGGRHQQGAVAPHDHPLANDLMIGEHASDNHLWSHVLSSVGSNVGDQLRNGGPSVGENLFEAISSTKSTSSSTGIFEPAACDYLKKIDGNWEFPNSSHVLFNNFVKNFNGYYDDTTTSTHDDDRCSIESERLTKLSNLVSTRSIAPPVDDRFNINPISSCDHKFLTSNSVENFSQLQQQLPAGRFCGTATVKNNPVFHHLDHVKMDIIQTQSLDMEAPISYYRRAFKGKNSNIYHADNFYGSMSHSPCTSTIGYSRLSRPLVDNIHASKPCSRPLNLSAGCKKKGLHAAKSTQTRNNNGRIQGNTNEGKKKRSGEDTSENTTVLKKLKHENSTVKTHAPKVKLGDRIAALQQIVSPFGKTDTASVLLEAIGYINFLQDQVQALCNPYMKLNSHKAPWGSLDRKDQKGGMKVDLRSRGLCLVPISCTTQVYHETSTTGSDYWTPTYRGCLYR